MLWLSISWYTSIQGLFQGTSTGSFYSLWGFTHFGASACFAEAVFYSTCCAGRFLDWLDPSTGDLLQKQGVKEGVENETHGIM